MERPEDYNTLVHDYNWGCVALASHIPNDASPTASTDELLTLLKDLYRDLPEEALSRSKTIMTCPDTCLRELFIHVTSLTNLPPPINGGSEYIYLAAEVHSLYMLTQAVERPIGSSEVKMDMGVSLPNIFNLKNPIYLSLWASSTKPTMPKIVPYNEMHLVTPESFLKLTKCKRDDCGQLIKGIFKQGFRCRACKESGIKRDYHYGCAKMCACPSRRAGAKPPKKMAGTVVEPPACTLSHSSSLQELGWPVECHLCRLPVVPVGSPMARPCYVCLECGQTYHVQCYNGAQEVCPVKLAAQLASANQDVDQTGTPSYVLPLSQSDVCLGVVVVVPAVLPPSNDAHAQFVETPLTRPPLIEPYKANAVANITTSLEVALALGITPATDRAGGESTYARLVGRMVETPYWSDVMVEGTPAFTLLDLCAQRAALSEMSTTIFKLNEILKRVLWGNPHQLGDDGSLGGVALLLDNVISRLVGGRSSMSQFERVALTDNMAQLYTILTGSLSHCFVDLAAESLEDNFIHYLPTTCHYTTVESSMEGSSSVLGKGPEFGDFHKRRLDDVLSCLCLVIRLDQVGRLALLPPLKFEDVMQENMKNVFAALAHTLSSDTEPNIKEIKMMNDVDAAGKTILKVFEDKYDLQKVLSHHVVGYPFTVSLRQYACADHARLFMASFAAIFGPEGDEATKMEVAEHGMLAPYRTYCRLRECFAEDPDNPYNDFALLYEFVKVRLNSLGAVCHNVALRSMENNNELVLTEDTPLPDDLIGETSIDVLSAVNVPAEFIRSLEWSDPATLLFIFQDYTRLACDILNKYAVFLAKRVRELTNDDEAHIAPPVVCIGLSTAYYAMAQIATLFHSFGDPALSAAVSKAQRHLREGTPLSPSSNHVMDSVTQTLMQTLSRFEGTIRMTISWITHHYGLFLSASLREIIIQKPEAAKDGYGGLMRKVRTFLMTDSAANMGMAGQQRASVRNDAYTMRMSRRYNSSASLPFHQKTLFQQLTHDIIELLSTLQGALKPVVFLRLHSALFVQTISTVAELAGLLNSSSVSLSPMESMRAAVVLRDLVHLFEQPDSDADADTDTESDSHSTYAEHVDEAERLLIQLRAQAGGGQI